MTKKENLENPNSCWNKAADDEPVFVLRAHDVLAPMTVRFWAGLVSAGRQMCTALGIARNTSEKERSAYTTANEMEKWPDRKIPD